MKLDKERKQFPRNSSNPNILNRSRMLSNIFIYAVLRNWEMVLPVIYFTRVKEVAIVTEKIARHLCGPTCFKAKFK